MAVEECLGIAGAPEAVTGSRQLLSQRPEVVDFAIEADDVAAAGRRHGLGRSLAEVDYGQPAMTEGYPRGMITHGLFAVWAAIGQVRAIASAAAARSSPWSMSSGRGRLLSRTCRHLARHGLELTGRSRGR